MINFMHHTKKTELLCRDNAEYYAEILHNTDYIKYELIPKMLILKSKMYIQHAVLKKKEKCMNKIAYVCIENV